MTTEELQFAPVLLTLPSSGLTPSLVVEILPYGLTVHRFIVQNGGKTRDIVIGPQEASDHLKQKYMNTIIGRYVNRLPVSSEPLAIERNGVKGFVKPEPNEKPTVSLHGGPNGFDSLPWTHLSSLEDATLFSSSEIAHLSSPSATDPTSRSSAIFRLVSEDGDQGCSGRLLLEVLFALVPPSSSHSETESELGSLVVVYRAKVEGKDVITPINLTQHWGFNLDTSTKPISIRDHNLTIKADNIIELDPETILSTGKLVSTAGTGHAHNGKKISEGWPDRNGGYDDYYLLNNTEESKEINNRHFAAPISSDFDRIGSLLSTTPESSAKVILEKSGLKLLFDTNQSGLMFYSNNFTDPSKEIKKIHQSETGEEGGYLPGSAAFIEFHDPLISFLYPYGSESTHSGSGSRDNDTLLVEDEVYNNWVKVVVKAATEA